MYRLLALALLLASGAATAQTANYRVTFDATWSAQTHPDGFPGDPHFSPLVGAVHNGSVLLWRDAEIASDGMERMAETGSTSGLVTEASALVASGGVREVLTGGWIPDSPGSVGMDITVSVDHYHVTLVSMIAPSPDWFVGTESRALRTGHGTWIPEVVVPLYVWDAGTDSGTSYTSPNADTNPREPIRRIEMVPFVVGGTLTPVGTMTFTQQVPASGGETPEAAFGLAVTPNPVRGIARVAVTASGEATLDLLDVRGRMVRQIMNRPLAGSRDVEIATGDLAPGVYVLRLQADGEVTTTRFTVAR